MNDFLYLTPNDGGLKLMDEFIKGTYQGTRAFLIGKSIEGREIKTYTVGEGAGRVAFFGAHHASEWITCNLLFAFLSRISDRARKGASAECDILRSFTFFVTPCVNPDGISLLTCGPLWHYYCSSLRSHPKYSFQTIV